LTGRINANILRGSCAKNFIAAPLDNCAARALRLETIYVCRYRGMRNASVAASRPASSRFFYF
jgi:hypothetical protein